MIENFHIGKKKIGKNCPTYFIADIAANHDGNLETAFKLIELAKESGADVGMEKPLASAAPLKVMPLLVPLRK